MDTVHQGDRDGVKGVYHINAVDEVTQWQVVGCTPAISEAWLAPLLTSMLKQFPFVILARFPHFHRHNDCSNLQKRRPRRRRSYHISLRLILR